MTLHDSDFPALYKEADRSSICAKRWYFIALFLYLLLLILLSFVAFQWPDNIIGAYTSIILFLISLGIIIWLKVQRPDDTWYNGRAVAESVKTRTWRWMMKAEPYYHVDDEERDKKHFLTDLERILEQNQSLSKSLKWEPETGETITNKMTSIRNSSLNDRLNIYKTKRINDQSNWYSVKASVNKRNGRIWFFTSIILHSLAILLLIHKIRHPEVSLPIPIITTMASAVLTWIQAKKYNELASSYTLAAHEIIIIKGGADSIREESQLSEFIIDSEAAFSREHTQWAARKSK